MRSDNMALYRDLTLYNFVYILLDYPTLFYDLLGEIRYDYSSSVCQLLWYKSVKILRDRTALYWRMRYPCWIMYYTLT